MKNIHILLVEDNEGDILLTTEALEEKKIVNKISVARNGQEALDFLLKQGEFKNAATPDLILLDVNLPKKKWTRSVASYKVFTSNSANTSNNAYYFLFRKRH